LPEPTYSIISPNVKYINNKWVDDDTAFISSVTLKEKGHSKSQYLKFNSDNVTNIFQVGTQNGNSKYRFTSIESAISNAINFSNYIENDTKKIIKSTYSFDLIFIIKIMFFVFLLLLLKYIKKKF
jgi:hypothetical protein